MSAPSNPSAVRGSGGSVDSPPPGSGSLHLFTNNGPPSVVPKTALAVLSDSGPQATYLSQGILTICAFCSDSVDADISLSDYALALQEFEQNYCLFVESEHQSRFVVIGEEFNGAFQSAEVEQTIAISAQIFSRHLTTVLGSVVKGPQRRGKWTVKLVSFMQRIYPFVRLTLEMTSCLSQATAFSMPLKVLVDGLGIILQAIHSSRFRS